MTPDRARQRPRTAAPHPSVANVRTGQWCAACKAYSGFTTDVVSLYPAGVTVVGSVTGCVLCNDPDDPEVNRA
ncbi:hypothetical protein ACFOOM_00915 [Streptomyces echinoruber]|uniref:Uncharacterized protein n=1 Tax=Streptomyces echinoruber TaxID=68898 RepID=A0A918QV28_9ACTN|nr:hypothetical protein [Streptomyces echinoruber]GGZ73254.1 hypothetical protein GCM10010389_08510 [Streptomyces echinoruber]